MDAAPYGDGMGSSGTAERVEVSFDLFALLDAMPDREIGGGRRAWTPEEDAALLRYWPVKRHRDVCRTIGVSENTALNRYRELTT